MLWVGLSRKNRETAREFAKDSWERSGFDPVAARRLSKERVASWKHQRREDSGVGSIIVILTVAGLMLQVIYYAIRIYNTRGCKSIPDQPQPWEPFGLD